MKEIGLVDVYRLIHPKTKAYTYESKPLKMKSRIDFLLIAECLQNNVKRAEIRTTIAPDYKAIFLNVEISNDIKRGPGSWKFHNQLLEDEEYKTLIKDSLENILEYYKDVESK